MNRPIRRTLSKSDFKLADDCWSKLYYKKLGCPSQNTENDYLAFLAEGGYLIGAVAKLFYPDGIDVDAQVRKPNCTYQRMLDNALRLTDELMQQDVVTIYEPAFMAGQRLVRVDVLVKRGDRLDLIEVKSKSQDSTSESWGSGWDPYLDDLAFQCLVVRAACPSMRVTPHLLTPDKSTVATIDNLTSYFELQELGYMGSFRQTDVKYVGSPELAEQIRTSGLLHTWDVQEIIEGRLEEVDERAAAYEEWLMSKPLRHPSSEIGKHCFKCEYDVSARGKQSGFSKCWKGIPTPERHIRDLYRLGSLGGHVNPIANKLIQEQRVGHDDIEHDDLLNSRGELGAYGERILIQIESTRNGTEWIDRKPLGDSLSSWEYPLHFIDFEASASPLPYHSGMRPYQTVVFQWSCHTIAAPDAEPKHSEYLNTVAAYPAIEFLQSLRESLGESGTALMWSKYERTQLRGLLAWLRSTEDHVPAGLIEWTSALIKSSELKAAYCDLRLVDQHELVSKHWFHPRMKGRTSLKVALPSALEAASSDRIDQWLEFVGLLDPQTGTRPQDPYRLLPDLGIEGLNEEQLNEDSSPGIIDGVSAMSAYQDMLYGKHMNHPDRKLQIQEALRRYCRLDTLAQVIIWEHWRTECGV